MNTDDSYRTATETERALPALLGMTAAELRELALRLGAPSYRGDQIASWLYAKNVERIEEMTNLPKSLRSDLIAGFVVGRRPPVSVTASSDGTKKYLYGAVTAKGEGDSASGVAAAAGADAHTDSPTAAGRARFVEAAYIPERTRATLCLSTQIGCKMGCLFCMTARQGFQGNLSAGEIVNQYLCLPERETVTNIVYMGMGEPLDNAEEVLRSLEVFTEPWGLGFGAKRITVSTIGVIPGMERFLAESACHLAVSLHSPFDEERRRLMPIEHIYPIREVIDVIRRADLGRHRRVSFEYIVFQGVNHGRRHVNELARLLQGIRCRVNLIRFHRIPGAPLEPAERGEMEEFQEALKAKGIPTTIRASRGEDVQAACGMLSTRRLVRAEPQDY